MRVLLFLPLALAFACLALLNLLAFLGVMLLARTLQVIAAARSAVRFRYGEQKCIAGKHSLQPL
jgi:hypothetical protein